MKGTLCLSMRTGTLILAAVDTILAALAACLSLVLLLNVKSFTSEVFKDVERERPSCLQEFIDTTRLRSPFGKTAVNVFLIFNFIYWIQKILLGSLLLYGVLKEKKNIIRLWMFYTLMLLILSVLFFLSAILLQIVHWKTIPLYVLAFVMREYSFWIVSSYLTYVVLEGKPHSLVDESQFNSSRDMDGCISVDFTVTNSNAVEKLPIQ